MNKRTLKFGVLIGLTGGTLMAAWIMIFSAITGNGFLTPLNLIAHTFWRDAPLDGAIRLGAIELGLLIHLTISISIGIVLAILVEHEELDGAMVFFLALGLGAGAWVVQTFAWSSIDGAASASMTPWVFAVAHVIFAVGSALVLRRLTAFAPETTDDPADVKEPAVVTASSLGNRPVPRYR